MAGAKLSFKGRVPKSFAKVQNPSIAPGIVTVSTLRSGIVLCPASRRAAALAASGARPEPLSATTSALGSFWIRANISPPMPVICGSQMPSKTAAAIAASAALPPAFKISIAVAAAKGWEVATMPLVAKTADRPGR